MKNFIYHTLFLALAVGTLLTSCSEMTEIESKPYDHIGGLNTLHNEQSEKYYADLRAYKQSALNYGRPVAFGWFSGWSPKGTFRRGYLTSMPDSMDFVSMWSGTPSRFELTPEQKADKEFVQKVKGTKLLEVQLLSYIGKGKTPNHIYDDLMKQAEAEGWAKDEKRLEKAKQPIRWKYWGYDGVPGSEAHTNAIKKFARAIYDSLVVNEWDGYDIDWEIGSGVFDMDGSFERNEDLILLIKELSQWMGPKSDPENKGHKLLCIDGSVSGVCTELQDYVDYFIIQSYSRVANLKWYACKPEKLILTENFEAHFGSGGQLLRQAAYMPENGFKGGVGAYRFDQDYTNAPNYKWMRQAIQINQQVFNEWKAKQP